MRLIKGVGDFNVGLLLAPLAHAGGKPRPGFYSYSVHHALFGEIGSQTIGLARAGRNVTVTMEARVKIRILFVTLLYQSVTNPAVPSVLA